jgi:dipeptidyl aminopeptidase/acylaminoacyl peptidase
VARNGGCARAGTGRDTLGPVAATGAATGTMDAPRRRPGGRRYAGEKPGWRAGGRPLARRRHTRVRRAEGPARSSTFAVSRGASENWGGSWGEDGTIVFTAGGAVGGGLRRVSPAGGKPEILTEPDAGAGEVSHSWPQVLPGGEAVIYTSSHTTGSYEDATIVAQALPSGPKKALLRGGYHGRYLSSGHLVYIREGTLFAAAFDRDRLEVTGEPAPALEGVTSSSLTGAALFAQSDRGAFVYVPGVSLDAQFAIAWVNSAGTIEPLRQVPGDYARLRFSPDGRQLAMDVRDGNQRDLWVYDWAAEALSRLTFDPGQDTQPIWTPDGRRIAFASDRADKGTRNLYWQRADGTGDAERLTVSNNIQWPGSWHPNGRFLAFAEIGRQTHRPDLMLLSMEGSEASGWKPGKPTVFLSTPSVENVPEFSPDGRWLAYMSNESGRFEVYVRPFPGPGGKWQVSTEGSRVPKWSRTGRQLLYLGLDQRVMVASYVVDGESFRAEKPRPWSEAPLAARADLPWTFDLHPDGQRLAVVGAPRGQSEVEPDGVVFVLNFFDYLRRIAPPKGRNELRLTMT